MSDVEKPDDWTDEQFEAYFGSEDDPLEDEPDFEDAEILDLYAGYDAATDESTEDGGTLA
jgi:hypothetical protein